MTSLAGKIPHILAFASLALVPACKREQESIVSAAGLASESFSRSAAPTISHKTLQQLSELKTRGYAVEIESSCLLGVSWNDEKFDAVSKTLESVELKQYLLRTIDQVLGKTYSLQLSTEAKNVKPELQLIKIQRFTATFADAEKTKLLITDNFSGDSTVLPISAEVSPSNAAVIHQMCQNTIEILPSLDHGQETLTFSESPERTPFNLPEGMRMSIQYVSHVQSVGREDRNDATFSVDLRQIQAGRRLTGINGHLTEVIFNIDGLNIKLPTTEFDSLGNLYKFHFFPFAGQQQRGTLAIQIIPRIPERIEDKQLTGEARLDLRKLKQRFPEFAEVQDQITLRTMAAPSTMYWGITFIDLLPPQSKSLLTQEALDTVYKATAGVQDLFDVREVLKEVKLFDAGILGGTSHVTRVEPNTIHLSDIELSNLETTKLGARHECIHIIDFHFKLSATNEFTQLFDKLLRSNTGLLDKIKWTGDHPADSAEELFETLIARVIDFKILDIESLNAQQQQELRDAFRITAGILQKVVPQSPIYRMTEGCAHSKRFVN